MMFNMDGSLYNEYDHIGFGKHKYKTWKWVKENDPSYLIWMAGASDDMPDRRKFINSLFHVEVSLMEDQQAAADAITEELLHGDHRVYRLQGGAGYGKSYAVMEIAQRAKRAGFTVRAMANSYVATQVLAESLEPVGVIPATIARSLCLRPDKTKLNESYGASEDTEAALTKILDDKCLLIVDEDSMCSDAVVQLVYTKMNEPGNTSKLLSVGDKKQLPSPEQEHLCAFTNILPAFELTIPKRYAEGSDLHKLETILSQDPFMLVNGLERLQGDHIVKHKSFDDLCDQMIQDINDYPDEQTIMLFYRRNAVAKANLMIRERIYGDTAFALVEGEQLRVMRTTFIPKRWNDDKGFLETINYYSGTFIKAVDPKISEVTVSFNQGFLPRNNMEPITVECLDKYFMDEDGSEIRIPLVFSKTEHQADPETVGGRAFNQGLEKVKQYCLDNNNWELYHYYRSRFLQIAYGYATTVHRSQGSSVDRVYLNPADILQGGSVAPKLAYVAGTRAKKELHYVLNEENDYV